MERHEHRWMTGIVGINENKLAWPTFPKVLATIVTAMSVLGIFLGLGTVTKQGWMIWLGLLVSAGILASHLVRRRQVEKQRKLTHQLLDARLISHCKRLASSDYMSTYYEGITWVVLVLTEDALHICPEDDPLTVFTTVPLYQIHRVQLGSVEVPSCEAPVNGRVHGADGDREDTIDMQIQVNNDKFYRLALCNFLDTPVTEWAEALQHTPQQPELVTIP